MQHETRKQREARRKRKRRILIIRAFIRLFLLLAVAGLLIFGVIKGILGIAHWISAENAEKRAAQQAEEIVFPVPIEELTEESWEKTEDSNTTEAWDFTKKDTKVYEARETPDTTGMPEEVVSEHAVLVEDANDIILKEKGAMTRINPASMTKVLTVLVAAEHLTGKEALKDTFPMTIDITDYSYSNDCSNVGFEPGEAVTVEDLFYGTVLPSGADAAVGLATYIAGSQEAFTALMNEKLQEMGLSDTAHFTNCVGIYDENHYCSVYDMAMIMRAAMANDWCREVLSAHTYTTSKTGEHPEGITISNWFLRRIEDKETGGTVVGGKTGYVVQSGNCAVSYAEDKDGNGFVCATANSTSGWRCIYDHVAIYSSVFTQ